ncbi:putative copper resistance protein D [Jannaschia faecimaris]|uniref:Putative copper resistance protein D n=1 Tax=Jannaschia faecimaris TaxID=1244108 RepID=A0A1H3TTB8_9RHOB|nr:CopD family protein [Jannaschia faecimaris]SDZ52569.1 putative copper resistance protein D [Jannaschia faecimaris]
MEGLAPIDAWAVAAIIVKAAGYGAALLAMGGPLFLVAFPDANDDVRRLARKIAATAALFGLVVLALRFGIRAARISGMGLPGAVDLMMLSFVWDSPLGTAAIWRGAGEVLVVAMLIGGAVGLGAGLVGALLISISYTFVGHALGDPRWLLAALLTVHLLAAAFWVGALAPLQRAAHLPEGATLLHRFGNIASATVALLILVGLVFAWLMTGSVSALLTTAYGWTLLAKLGVVTGLMALAALNKWRLVPALASGAPAATTHLRRLIHFEALAVMLILIATATLTSITTPPVNL